MGAAGVWLAYADAKARRTAILELLSLVKRAADEPGSAHGWPLAQTRAEVAVFLCGFLRAQLCTSGAGPESGNYGIPRFMGLSTEM